MFSDGIIQLFEGGVITNSRKATHRGKIVASFCMGTQRLYDFIDNNPVIEFHSSDYTNDPWIISRQEKMVAINGALQVDLTGQVCADSLGYVFYSGFGGQVDFIRGAARSRGGKPIIALPSTTDDGKRSRIVPHLSEGSGVVTTRGDVHYVVTEYGAAQLHGKTIRERCVALISVAHPGFRDELLEHAKEHNYVYEDQVSLNLAARYPKELESVEVFDGVRVAFRPARPTDEDMVRELFYSASKKTTYYRFHGQLQTMRHRDAQRYCNIDYDRDMVIVAVIREEGNERVIALGQYNVYPATGMAECAFLVVDKYQNKGIGTHMLHRLIKIAHGKGVKGFIAEVLFGNQAMLRVFHKCGYVVKSHVDDGVYHLSFTFDEKK
jgi:RimJ/RimL family protein N-acetyltransferase